MLEQHQHHNRSRRRKDLPANQWKTYDCFSTAWSIMLCVAPSSKWWHFLRMTNEGETSPHPASTEAANFLKVQLFWISSTVVFCFEQAFGVSTTRSSLCMRMIGKVVVGAIQVLSGCEAFFRECPIYFQQPSETTLQQPVGLLVVRRLYLEI
jgi:hypothetical protein